MQKEETMPDAPAEKAPEIGRKQRFRRGFCVFLLFLTLLFLILPIATRVRVKESGTYTTRDYVALYLFTYHHLPGNYVLKSDPSVKDSGMQPSDGRYIGGDVFYYSGKIRNYTDKTELRECDLSYDESKTERGSKRLVYAVDCSEIFYTYTHYGQNGEPAFVRVTKFSIQKTSNVLWIIFAVLVLTECAGAVLVSRKDRSMIVDLKAAGILFLKIAFYIVFIPPFLVCYAVYSAVKAIRKKKAPTKSE